MVRVSVLDVMLFTFFIIYHLFIFLLSTYSFFIINNNNNNNTLQIFQQDNLSIFTNIVIIRVLLA